MLSGMAVERVTADQVSRTSPLLVVIRDEDQIRGRELFKDNTFELNCDAAYQRLLRECIRLKLPKPKLRLVVDMSHAPSNLGSVNDHVKPLPFSMSSVADLLGHVEQGARGIVIDLERAYWQLPIAMEDRPHLGFSFGGHFYRFSSCPFGASFSAWFQSVVSAEAARFLMAIGMLVVVYLDDFGIVVPNGADAEAVKQRALTLLRILGFSVNDDKVTGPDTTFKFLGIWIDTIALVAKVDRMKARDTLELAEYVGTRNERSGIPRLDRVLARKLAGRLSWMSILAQGGKHRLRWLWKVAEGSVHLFPHPLTLDLFWWRTQLSRWAEGDEPQVVGGRLVTQEALQRAYVVVSDASNTGAGYWHCPLQSTDEPLAGAFAFKGKDRTASSTKREALAVLDFLRTHPDKVRDRVVLFVTDNLALSHLLNQGHSDRLAPTLRTAMDLADSLNTAVLGLFIPRELNQLADTLSRVAPSTTRASIQAKLGELVGAQ